MTSIIKKGKTITIKKGNIYTFKAMGGKLKGILEGKIISYNPHTEEATSYNVKMKILKEVKE